MELNEELGFFFDNDAAPEEDFNAPHVDTDALKSQMSGHLDKFKSGFKTEEQKDEQENTDAEKSADTEAEKSAESLSK